MLKHKEALLHDIAEGVRRESKHRIEVVEVVFVTPNGEYELSLDQALFALANDTYWDERGNWADAESAKVRVM
jgi:hypothetical protein